MDKSNFYMDSASEDYDYKEYPKVKKSMDVCPIYFVDYSNRSLVNMLQHVKEINPNHSIRIYYSDTYHEIDLTKPYAYIKVYQDFIKISSMNNDNLHEYDFVNPVFGDYFRLIMVKDIKSIEF